MTAAPAEQLALAFPSRADLVARLREAGVPAACDIAVHRNRRVLASFHPRAGLRVHAAYVDAPDEVVLAIVRWARPGVSRRARRDAARVFLAFPVHGNSPPPVRRRPEAPEPGDDTRLARLYGMHQDLNQRWFGGALAMIPIELSGRMRRKLGHYSPRRNGEAVIALSRRHLRRDGWAAVAATLLHEMVHQWQDETGLPVDHGSEFRRKAAAVGIEPRATTRGA
ncbi:MAG: SprT-like domain-containing protein [Gemmatimonadales bacterium]